MEIANSESEFAAEMMGLKSRNANLPIGVGQAANREIGVPGLTAPTRRYRQ